MSFPESFIILFNPPAFELLALPLVTDCGFAAEMVFPVIIFAQRGGVQTERVDRRRFLDGDILQTCSESLATLAGVG